MKNKIAAWGLIVVSCVNPNLQSHLDELKSQIEALESSIEIVDVDGIVKQVEELEQAVSLLVIETEASQVGMSELQEMITILQEQLNELENRFSELAPGSAFQGILERLQEVHRQVDILVGWADYDYDGVLNAVDKCPDTPITEINEVNEEGCSPSQLEN